MKTTRTKYIVLSDDTDSELGLDDEENISDQEAFGTPPSSPIRSFSLLRLKAQETPPRTEKPNLPRSLARTGSKKAVRQVFHFRSRLEEMKGCLLGKHSSFFICEWAFEFDDRVELLSKDFHPERNVKIMLNRIKKVYGLFQRTFAHVSGVYVGKTTNMRSRFNHHMKTKSKEEESLAMIGLNVFRDEDVHESDRDRWSMTCEVLGFQYERLLTATLVEDGSIPLFSVKQEPGGGGRCGGENTMECIVYVLVSISNNQ